MKTMSRQIDLFLRFPLSCAGPQNRTPAFTPLVLVTENPQLWFFRGLGEK